MGRFIPLPPSAYWRYPSQRHPFFLLKAGKIKDNEWCPQLQDLSRSLLEINKALSEPNAHLNEEVIPAPQEERPHKKPRRK